MYCRMPGKPYIASLGVISAESFFSWQRPKISLFRCVITMLAYSCQVIITLKEEPRAGGSSFHHASFAFSDGSLETSRSETVKPSN